MDKEGAEAEISTAAPVIASVERLTDSAIKTVAKESMTPTEGVELAPRGHQKGVTARASADQTEDAIRPVVMVSTILMEVWEHVVQATSVDAIVPVSAKRMDLVTRLVVRDGIRLQACLVSALLALLKDANATACVARMMDLVKTVEV